MSSGLHTRVPTELPRKLEVTAERLADLVPVDGTDTPTRHLLEKAGQGPPGVSHARANKEKNQMARVAAYHTARPETGGERNVYHNDDECPRGKEISKEDWRSGTDGRDLCKVCK